MARPAFRSLRSASRGRACSESSACFLSRDTVGQPGKTFFQSIVFLLYLWYHTKCGGFSQPLHKIMNGGPRSARFYRRQNEHLECGGAVPRGGRGGAGCPQDGQREKAFLRRLLRDLRLRVQSAQKRKTKLTGDMLLSAESPAGCPPAFFYTCLAQKRPKPHRMGMEKQERGVR